MNLVVTNNYVTPTNDVEDRSEPPEYPETHPCGECVYWEEPPRGNCGFCSFDLNNWFWCDEDTVMEDCDHGLF